MRSRLTALLGAALVVCAWTVPAAADSWNEKTVLKFDEAVMIPGVTLQPGTYVFQIGDATTARHTIRITRESDNHVLATVQAIPMRRTSATNDIVLKFEPTERGSAPALKGWFYPGRVYGHEFVYPDDEARQIAERSRTLVLADDAKGDMSGKGTLHMIDAKGAKSDWHGDEALNREWGDWNRTRHNTAGSGTTGSQTTTTPQAAGASGSSGAATSSGARK